MKHYLWGKQFYAMCDMKTLYRILEYDGPIHCIRRWCQELFAYDFITIHRPAIMMKDVDALNRGPYSKVIASYLAFVTTIKEYDKLRNKRAYDNNALESLLKEGLYSIKKPDRITVSASDRLRTSVTLMRLSNSIRSNDHKLQQILKEHLQFFQNPANSTVQFTDNTVLQPVPASAHRVNTVKTVNTDTATPDHTVTVQTRPSDSLTTDSARVDLDKTFVSCNPTPRNVVINCLHLTNSNCFTTRPVFDCVSTFACSTNRSTFRSDNSICNHESKDSV